MASIKKDDKTGTYYFVLDLPRDPVTGARKQAKRRGFKNKKEAQAAAAALYHELTKGTHIAETALTFTEYVEMFLEEYALSGSKPSSVRIRRYQLESFYVYFKAVRIQDITKKMYQDAINGMKKEDYAVNTIQGNHSAGRMLFNRAKEFDLIKINPTDYIKLPRVVLTVDDLEQEVDIPKYLEKEELALFINTAATKGLEGDYEAFLTLAYTGLRLGELCPLRDTDVDFTDNTISVTKTYYNETNVVDKYELLPPKTKKSKRVIDIDPIVTEAIKGYIHRSKAFKMLHRNRYYDKGYIMPNKDGYPGYPCTLKHYEYRMRRLLKLAGLNSSLTPHSLRHTHASLLAEAGVPIQDIMDRLGHKDDKTTRLIYLHVTKTRKKDASHKFGEMMKELILNKS